MMGLIDRAMGALMAMLGIGLMLMIALSVFNVVSRYVFASALLWADEVAVFAMIALAFFGAVVCGWRDRDIRMDILTGLAPAGFRRAVHIAQQVTIAALCSWVAWQSLDYISKAYQFGMRSDGAHVPVWLVHAVIPASLFLIAAIAVLRGFRLLLGEGGEFRAAETLKAAQK